MTNCYIPTVYADDSSIESESGTWQIISIDENTEKIEFIDRESGEKSIALNYLNGSNGDLFVEIWHNVTSDEDILNRKADEEYRTLQEDADYDIFDIYSYLNDPYTILRVTFPTEWGCLELKRSSRHMDIDNALTLASQLAQLAGQEHISMFMDLANMLITSHIDNIYYINYRCNRLLDQYTEEFQDKTAYYSDPSYNSFLYEVKGDIQINYLW